jgi:hypothetical protein
MRPEFEDYSEALQVLKLTLIELNGELVRLVSDPAIPSDEAIGIADAINSIMQEMAFLLTEPDVILAAWH